MSMFGPSVLQSVAGTPYAARESVRAGRRAERRASTGRADPRVDSVELAEAVHEPEANDREEAKEDRQSRALPAPPARRPRLDVQG